MTTTMNEETSIEHSSYLSYEINGTRYILQTISDPAVVDDEDEDDNDDDDDDNDDDNMVVKTASTNQEQQTAAINILDDTQMVEKEEEEEEESVSLVCLDGRVYTFQNGELQELDFSRIIDQNELREKLVVPPKENNNDDDDDDNDNDNDNGCEPRYITNDDLITGDGDGGGVNNVDEHSQARYQVVTVTTAEPNENNFIVERSNNVNANDFVEVVTAFKCKICTYTSQDKAQLLQHFQKTHVNPKSIVDDNLQIKAESKIPDQVKLLYMCGECSSCFPSIQDCKQHMINDHQLAAAAATPADKKDGKSGKDNLKDNSKDAKQVDVDGGDGGSGGGGVRRSVENGDAKKHQVQIRKPLNSEYMLNKRMIELMERNVKCSYRGCPYKFCTEETMQQHSICHTTDSQSGTTAFKCTLCRDMKFTKWRQCSLHLWKKHQIDIGLFTCKICKAYKSATMVKLLTHMRVHSETREYECSECSKCFKQASQLRNHRVMHLDRKTLEVTRWYTSKKCDMCGKTYANSKCLKSHIQAVHSKLRPYVCNVCGHSSARKAMLQMHLRQHTGDKPFGCELCEYKTGDHNTLRRHIMQHTGFRPYKCPHCSYTAIQSSSYKNHLKSRHPLLSGLFTCDLCPFKTVKNESYIQHVRDHEKGLIKPNIQRKDGENVEVFPGNIAAAQLIYSCLGAFSKVGDTLEANLMSSSTSADGTSQTITIQIPSKHLEGSLPSPAPPLPSPATQLSESVKNDSPIEQEDDEETMHCFLKIPREQEQEEEEEEEEEDEEEEEGEEEEEEEEESIDTGGITIPAPEPPEESSLV